MSATTLSNSTSQTTGATRPSSLTIWKVIVGALALTTIAAFILYLIAAIELRSKPFFGAMITRTMVVNAGQNTGNDPWSALEAGMQSGDLIVAINGRDLFNDPLAPTDYAQARERFQNIMSNLPRDIDGVEPITVSFIRRGDPTTFNEKQCEAVATSFGAAGLCTLTFTPGILPDIDFVSYFLLGYGAAIVIIIIGLAILRYRFDSYEGIIAATIAFLSAIYAGGLFDVGTTGTGVYLWLMASCWLGGTIATFGITYPKRLKIVRSFKNFEYFPLILTTLIGLIAVYRHIVPASPWDPANWTQIGTGTAAIGMSVLLIANYFQRRNANTPRTRDQSNSIFIGAILILVPVVAWIVSRTASIGMGAGLPFNLEALTPLLVFPNTAIAYAVLRYHHFDTDRAISQGITYSIMGAALVISIFLLSLGGALITLEFVSARDFITVSVILFIMVMFFTPVRNRLQERIDEIYFRKRRNLQTRVEEFGRKLTTLNNYGEISQEFVRTLKYTVSPSTVFIFLRSNTSDDYSAIDGTGSKTDIRFAEDSATIRVLSRSQEALSLQPGQPLNPDLLVDRPRLNLLGASILVPIQGTNMLSGFVALGHPQAKETYDFDEVRFIDNMVSQLAVATERSHVINSLERRVRELDVLSQVGQAVNFTVEFDDLLELIYAQTSKLVPVPNFYLALYEEKIDRMYFAFFLENDERYAERENQRWNMDNSLFTQIVKTGNAIRVANYKQETDRRGITRHHTTEKINAWMGVPLLAGRRKIGVMAAGKTRDQSEYTDEQFKIFSDIGSLAATSIDKANLFNQTKIRERQLTVLNDISRQLVATESDVERLLQIIMNSAVDILNAEAGSLLLGTEDDSGDIEFRVVIGGGGADLVGTRIKAGQGIVGRVMDSGLPEIVNDVVSDPRHLEEVAENFVSRSLLAVPLIAKDQVIGVLEVINKTDGTPFVDEDSDLLTTFAGQAAVAIENARLFQLTDQQLEMRVRELETLEKLDAELNRTLELNDVAEITVRQAMNILRADAGALGIVHRSPDFLQIAAMKGYSEDQFPPGAEGMIWPLDQGIVKRVMRSRQADIAMDVSIDPDYNSGIPNSNSQITLPMMSGTEVNAILILEKNSLPRFSLPDWAFAQRIAEHASIAIANAQFYAALNQANRSKSEFMGFAAHELKNPLASVKGYADVMISGMTGNLSDQQKNFVAIIRSNAQRMETIISDLRDAAKVDAGEFRVEPEPMNIYASVVETLRPFVRVFDEKNQKLVNKVPEDLPLVMADDTRVIQVLTNLVSNAHKYSPSETTITVAAHVDERYIDQKGKQRGKMVVVSVTDEGLGMSEEDQNRLFKERYFRSTNREALEQPGTGLGMLLTYNIIQQHGGEIWLKSKLGEGSTFFFSIPVFDEEKMRKEIEKQGQKA